MSKDNSASFTEALLAFFVSEEALTHDRANNLRAHIEHLEAISNGSSEEIDAAYAAWDLSRKIWHASDKRRCTLWSQMIDLCPREFSTDLYVHYVSMVN